MYVLLQKLSLKSIQLNYKNHKRCILTQTASVHKTRIMVTLLTFLHYWSDLDIGELNVSFNLINKLVLLLYN